jgi:hypothetical protein
VDVELKWTFPFFPQSGASDYKLIENWRDDFLRNIADIPTVAQTNSALFSPGCTTHCATISNAFWNLKIGHKTSMEQALFRWLEYEPEAEGPTTARTFRWIAKKSVEPFTIECFGLFEWVFVTVCVLAVSQSG